MKTKTRTRRILADVTKKNRMVVTFETGAFSGAVIVYLEGGQKRYRIGRGDTFSGACAKLSEEIVILGQLNSAFVSNDLVAAHTFGAKR